MGKKVEKTASAKLALEATRMIENAKQEFEACRGYLNELKNSRNMWNQIDETYVTIKDYEQRAGFRLVSQSFSNKETAAKFFEAFNKTMKARYKTVKIVSCGRAKLTNALEILIASQFVISHENSNIV